MGRISAMPFMFLIIMVIAISGSLIANLPSECSEKIGREICKENNLFYDTSSRGFGWVSSYVDCTDKEFNFSRKLIGTRQYIFKFKITDEEMKKCREEKVK